jgi:hypothetical protein
MAEYKIKLGEILNLAIELEGYKNPETGETIVKGIINRELNLVGKYWLTKLAKTVADEKAKVEALRTELIKQYGTTNEDGTVQIQMYTDETKTTFDPIYVEFMNELAKLLSEETTLTYEPIKLSLLNKIDTDENYAILYNFIDPTA